MNIPGLVTTTMENVLSVLFSRLGYAATDGGRRANFAPTQVPPYRAGIECGSETVCSHEVRFEERLNSSIPIAFADTWVTMVMQSHEKEG